VTTRFWRVRGYDSIELLLDITVPVEHFSMAQMSDLLRALAAKSLSAQDTIGAYARRGTKTANNLLKVIKDGPNPTFLCGVNPHFIADVVDADGKIATGPVISKSHSTRDSAQLLLAKSTSMKSSRSVVKP
jgi:hypothetical protein